MNADRLPLNGADGDPSLPGLLLECSMLQLGSFDPVTVLLVAIGHHSLMLISRIHIQKQCVCRRNQISLTASRICCPNSC